MNIGQGARIGQRAIEKCCKLAPMGISFLSAHTFQIELEAGKLAVLDMQDMPKMLDWCLLHRRDSTLVGLNGAFREFVLAHGSDLATCRI